MLLPMYQTVALCLLCSLTMLAQKASGPNDGVPQQAYAQYPNGQKVPYVQVIPGGAIYIANGPEMLKGHTVQLVSDENHPIVIKPQDGGFWGWLSGEAGSGVVVGMITLIITMNLAYRQNRLQTEMNVWQKQDAIRQAEWNASEAQRDADLQAQIHQWQREQAEGEVFIPTFLKLLEANRSLEAVLSELEPARKVKAELDEHSFPRHLTVVEGSGEEEWWRRQKHVREWITDLSRQRAEAEHTLYPAIESICYLIDKNIVTAPKFIEPFRERLSFWMKNLDQTDSGLRINRYPYFEKQHRSFMQTQQCDLHTE